MKGKLLFGGIAGAACLVATSVWAAEPIDKNLVAAVYNTKLVQAMDECPSGQPTSVGGVEVCAPANSTTDGTNFSVGKLLVKAKGGAAQVLAILKSTGNFEKADKKSLNSKALRVKLTVRVTRNTGVDQFSNPTGAVTWVDTEVECGDGTTPPVGATGNWVYKADLAATGPNGCALPAEMAANATSKEIISASIIDTTTDKVVAVPGVRRKF